MPEPDWFPDWSGEVAAVVASGGSLRQADLDLLRGRVRAIAVNRSFELAPWADALYGADPTFWQHYPAAREFAGLRITSDDGAARHWGLRRITVEAGVHMLRLSPPGIVGSGGNSAFQALNLAVQWGARRILLLGLDLCGEHWHAAHPAPLKNPRAHTLAKWRRRFDHAADDLRRLGVDVINCSPSSALTAYPKMTVAAALARFGIAEREAA